MPGMSSSFLVFGIEHQRPFESPAAGHVAHAKTGQSGGVWHSGTEYGENRRVGGEAVAGKLGDELAAQRYAGVYAVRAGNAAVVGAGSGSAGSHNICVYRLGFFLARHPSKNCISFGGGAGN